MGRKSAAKSHANAASSTSGAPPSAPDDPRRLCSPPASCWSWRSSASSPTRDRTSPRRPPRSRSAAPVIPDVPATAKLGPHPQPNLPPLPFQAYAPPRPMETVRAVYRFAAEHPEVLSYVPCFCGCERSGHKGQRRLLRESAQRAGRRHRVGTARTRLRGVHRRGERGDADDALGRQRHRHPQRDRVEVESPGQRSYADADASRSLVACTK